MKKNYSLSLLVLILCMIGANVSAHDIAIPNADGVTVYYNYINNDTELAVTFAGDWYGLYTNEYSGAVAIPEEVTHEGRTLKVTCIQNSAFSGCYELTSVTIPNSVTNIGNYTFSECRNLTSVNIPDGVTSIGSFTFNGCSSLTQISIPDGVTSIGESAFDGCSALNSISIPNGVTKIGASAFYGCYSFTSVDVPNGVTNIEDETFAGCNNLTSITIGNSVVGIGNYAFAGCRSLISITIPNSVTSIGDYAFYKCYGLASIDMGNGVTSIGTDAFSECTSLPSVTIGNSVMSIGDRAFFGCSSLKSITIPQSVTHIGNDVFFNCHDLNAVHISDLEAWCNIQFVSGLNSLYHLYLNGEERTNLVIPESVTSVGNYAFANCYRLISISIPNGVTSIGGNAFRNCYALKDMYCYAEQVPQTGNAIFAYSDYTNATLHVPAASVDAYSNAEQWKDFGNIVALLDQGVYRPFYYYQGNKIPLTLNNDKVVVSVPKENKEVSERIKANVQILTSIRDDIYDIYVITQSDYEKLTSLEFWEEDAKSVILTSCYFTGDNKDVAASPYLNVQLKKEEDIDLLTSYAEHYKLTIVRNSPLMPLWYILAVTPESENNPLECANELYESGNFASSVPDLVDVIFPQTDYRPFVEEGKVWKVGDYSGNSVKRVEYYYFDGVIIINGKTCKQMMRQRYVSPDLPEESPLLTKVGAWYEEDKKVYEYDSTTNQFKLMYDFSLDANETLQINNSLYVVGSKQTGGIKGFKGVYREVWEYEDGENTFRCAPWLEGVGGVYGPPTTNVFNVELADPAWFLMSCTVGDEVIYLNDEYEDGATPGDLNGKKQRFDFTHTVKTKPKAPKRREKRGERREEASGMQSLYGEYNEQKLDINLDPLDDAYLVRITDESGKTVYEKAINAGTIVALNIDISSYAEGRYTVTVENSGESFTGIFDTNTTGIKENVKIERLKDNRIYNLQGQRMSSLRRGVNIVNGRKVYVK